VTRKRSERPPTRKTKFAKGIQHGQWPRQNFWCWHTGLPGDRRLPVQPQGNPWLR
jgi:hypothetical protein